MNESCDCGRDHDALITKAVPAMLSHIDVRADLGYPLVTEFHTGMSGIWWCREAITDVMALVNGDWAVAEAELKNLKAIVFPTVWAATSWRNAFPDTIPIEKARIIPDTVAPCAVSEKKPGLCVYAGEASRVLGILLGSFSMLNDEKLGYFELRVFDNNPGTMLDAHWEMLNEMPWVKYESCVDNAVVREHLAEADFLVMPETKPRVAAHQILEGLSAECRIIAPSFSGIHEECGPFFTPYDWSSDPYANASSFISTILTEFEKPDRSELAPVFRAAKMTVDTTRSDIATAARWGNLVAWLEFNGKP